MIVRTGKGRIGGMNTSNEKKNAAIGVFDSGVGGLTVAREIMSQLPDEEIVYFGDTARVPYGNKSRATVTRYSEQIIRFLLTQNVKAIVIACNTASSHALEYVAREFPVPIIGVIEPGARAAVSTTKNGRIGVIGTEGTISSEVYTRQIHKLAPSLSVTGKACPLFVPLVEEGWIKDSVTREVASRYLETMWDTGIDTLILGCTHYPLLRPLLEEIMGSSVTLVNPAYETARDLKALLTEKDRLCEENDHTAIHRFYVSDKASNFSAFANSILPCNIEDAHVIPIEEF